MEDNLKKATRLVPCSVVLLSVATKDAKDVMTATAMFVSEDPPLFNVSVAKHILSHELIEQAGEFALNIASSDQVALAKQLGSTHGRAIDKFEKFNLATEAATKVKAPLLKGCFANIECKVITSHTAANYTIYLGEVIAFKAREDLKPIAWLDNKYFALNQEAK
ncbi:MAG: flavin reductase family protein [Deltaproteobacteria bacterium]|jgi:flavin reductase (DIM6/NTAB) family NADH-FMN oxidoreductase RutF|nr:flavin reductase family protein [Deltaproteobacteria bacterium]